MKRVLLVDDEQASSEIIRFLIHKTDSRWRLSVRLVTEKMR